MYSYATAGLGQVTSPTGLTPEEEIEAICRYQPCGCSALCPCPPGMPTGTIPGNVQQLPPLVTTAPPNWWVVAALLFLTVAAPTTTRRRRKR